MKSLGTYTPPETVGLEFTRLSTPRGRTFPRAPVAGELYTMEVDEPEPDNGRPWHSRGTYVFDGFAWQRMSDGARARKSSGIGSQKIEVEVAGSPDILPNTGDGYFLTNLLIIPSSRRARLAGSASMWVDLQNSGFVWLSVHRGGRCVGISAGFVEAGKPSTLSMSFIDHPMNAAQQEYVLRIHTDQLGFMFVNQCNRIHFDGFSQTAFTVAEDIGQ